jgi:hypothetical protein
MEKIKKRNCIKISNEEDVKDKSRSKSAMRRLKREMMIKIDN